MTSAGLRLGIVSWNTAELLDRCLTALPAALAGLDTEVVVVDNASSDGSASVAEAHDWVTVIRNPSNVGYARAMNQALGGTAAPVLIALNPDTVAPPKSLALLVERLEADDSVALVAPRLVDGTGRLQHSAYVFPSPTVAAAVSFIPPAWQKGRLGQRLWLEGAAPHDRCTDVDWVTGAVHVLRASALGGAPPYDERWFMYVEDLELCWRLSRRGWRRRLEADIEVVHTGNASGAQAWGGGRTARYMEASYDWYRRDRGEAAARRWALVNTLGASLHAAVLAAGGVLGAPDVRGERRFRSRELCGVIPVHWSALVEGGRAVPTRTGPPSPPSSPEAPRPPEAPAGLGAAGAGGPPAAAAGG